MYSSSKVETEQETTAGDNIISFCMESRNALYVFLPDGIFLPCDHGLDFDASLRDDSFNKGCSRGLRYLA